MDITSSGQENAKRHSDMLTDVSLFENEILRGRPVLDIQCSPHVETQGGVFLAAYGAVGQASLGVDGKPFSVQTGGFVILHMRCYPLQTLIQNCVFLLFSKRFPLNKSICSFISLLFFRDMSEEAAGVVCLWHTALSSRYCWVICV